MLAEITITFALSLLILYICEWASVPSIIGLIAAGILAGPHGLAWVGPASVHMLAEVGIIVLLFTVGLEVPLPRVLRMLPVMLRVGMPQVAVCLLLTSLLTWWYFGGFRPAMFAGILVAMSSTAVAAKVLTDRGEITAPHGQLALAVLLLQDLLVVVCVLAVPVLARQGDGAPQTWLASLKSLGVVVCVLLVGSVLLPRVLHRVLLTRNRELFLITLVVACLGTAAITAWVGLSLALGAFLAGLAISGSEYGHQSLAEMLPFRGTLSSLFFVSIGMLLDLRFVGEHGPAIAAVVSAVLVVKALAVLGPALWWGYPLRTTVLVVLALAQIGEFSFILAQSGLAAGLLSVTDYQLFLAAAVVTIGLTPLFIAAGPRVVDAVARRPCWARWFAETPVAGPSPAHKLTDHVIIAGLGFSGRNVAAVLKQLDIPFVVVDLNAETAQAQQKAGSPILYGDCGQPAVLEHAGIARARAYVVAISDQIVVRRTVAVARQLNPSVRVVVRTRFCEDIEELRRLGANQVVPEEAEAALEVLVRVLEELATPPARITELTERIRVDHYQAFGGRARPGNA